ncbi:hypothetical protein HNP98_002407 [Hymenobacter sp. 9A]|uniref:Uncharacterized protein n=1 Tax=Hymenobacter caeli TaxID=2735894 RepID=A0ABX2FQX0_9BACT|nr:hypothetical protein [Hymenobacter caeli]
MLRRLHPSLLPGNHRGRVNEISPFRYEPKNPGRPVPVRLAAG